MVKHKHGKSQFVAQLQRASTSASNGPKAFVIIPPIVSQKLPRRGRTSIEGRINGAGFQATLEPDGQLSHWLPLDDELMEVAAVSIGDVASFEIMALEPEPEPKIPSDLQEALARRPEAQAVWQATTTIARVDWIHWISSAKQTRTRAKRIGDACDMLASGKRRVCCFDPSGYYSKALGAPRVAD